MTYSRDYYEVLGLERSCSVAEIKKAYRQLAVKYHPDKNPGDREAEERFKEASEAYAVLSDPEKKARYDQFGHQGVEGQAFNGFDPSSFGDFADILGDLFGFGMGDIFGRRRGARSGPRRGSDLRYTMKLSLEEAARGVEKMIRVPRMESCEVCGGTGSAEGTAPETCSTCRGGGQVMYRQGFLSVARTCPGCGGTGKVNPSPCSECRGRGRVEKEAQLKVRIPAGVDSGMQLRLSGEGEPGSQGAPRGDLYVVLHVRDHELFHRDGAHLHFELPISVFQAILGDIIKVQGILGDEIEVKIPSGSQPGDVIRLRGHGMPGMEGRRGGDLLAHLDIRIPKKLSAEQRRAVEAAAALIGSEAHHEGFFEKVKRALGND